MKIAIGDLNMPKAINRIGMKIAVGDLNMPKAFPYKLVLTK